MFQANKNPNATTTNEWVNGSPYMSGYRDGLNSKRADLKMIGLADYRRGFTEGQRDKDLPVSEDEQ